MDTTEKVHPTGQETEAQRPAWTTPRLTTHGTVASLTAFVSGAPGDGQGGSQPG